MICAPDGTGLLTDLYLARPLRPLPTVLMRCPYGRRGPYGTLARLLAERGYHAVVQSTRGTFGSGGQLDPDREAADGRAAAEWIVGPVSAELHVTSSRAHTDFFARLCDVGPRGRSVNVTDGLLRLTAGGPRQIRVDLWPTAHRFGPDHRIRLQVSSGAHPRYARNPGTGEPLATATSLSVAEQTVHHDPGRPSAVLLAVLDAG